MTSSAATGIGDAASWPNHPLLAGLAFPFAMACFTSWTSNPAAYGHLGFGNPNNSPNVNNWVFSWYVGSAGADVRPSIGDGSSYYFPSLSLSVADGDYHFLVCSVTATTATTYRDGVLVASEAHGLGTLKAATEPWAMFPAASDGGTFNMVAAGACSFAAVWKRALSEAEVSQLNADPYQMLDF